MTGYRVFRLYNNRKCYLKACAVGEHYDWTHDPREADLIPRSQMPAVFKHFASEEVWGYEKAQAA